MRCSQRWVLKESWGYKTLQYKTLKLTLPCLQLWYLQTWQYWQNGVSECFFLTHLLSFYFLENKARYIFRKTNISYPLIPTCTCAYQGGGRNVRFTEVLTCFVFLKQPFWESTFALLPTNCHFLVTKLGRSKLSLAYFNNLYNWKNNHFINVT